MKKNKIKNEDVTINFRIPRALKAKIINEASVRNLTISKYLRETLEEIYGESAKKPKESLSETRDYLFSKEFVQFVFWIYRKLKDNRREENDDIEGYINLIKGAGKHLPGDVVDELDKVLMDLLRIRTAAGSDGNYYRFTDHYDRDKKLDYKKLEDFFLGYGMNEHLADKEFGY